MKKNLLFIAMAALTIASCSKDQDKGINRGRAIDFRTAVETRASEVTIHNLTSIYVQAIKANGESLFNIGQEFTKNGSFFTSSPAYFWPGENDEVSFYAYAPSQADLGAAGAVTIDNTTKEFKDYAPNSVIEKQKDFITANAKGKKSVNEKIGVPLKFDHRLSQIEVKAKNSNANYTYKVVGVRIGKAVSKGTFNFETAAWTLGTDKANYVASETDYGTPKQLNATAVSMMLSDGDNAMLLPQQLVAWDSANDKANAKGGAYIALKLQITSVGGARMYPSAVAGDYGWVAVAIDTKWEAGKKYVYTLDFTNGAGKVDPEKPTPVDPKDPFNPGDDVFGEPIKFTVDISDWDTTTPEISVGM